MKLILTSHIILLNSLSSLSSNIIVRFEALVLRKVELTTSSFYVFIFPKSEKMSFIISAYTIPLTYVKYEVELAKKVPRNFPRHFIGYNYNLLAASSSMITVTSSWFCKTLAGRSTVTSPSIMPLIASALSVPKAINKIFLLCMIEPIPIDNA